jgi:2-amino-4-hydroxy-6-hydroxymethyldihydropteridine diphosphokinase
MGERVFIALGSNLGDRFGNLEAALRALDVVTRSSIYETAPRDYLEQPWFLNMVVECRWADSPVGLLAKLMGVERKLGRERGSAIERGPRVIDLDILLFGELVMDTPPLQIPHPRMLERRFVLEPLLEIAPGLRDPRSGQLIGDFLPAVVDQQIRRMEHGGIGR